jgi:hypothetical protein
VDRVLAELGRSHLALGDYREASRVWRESLRLAGETQATFVALEALVGVASLRLKRADANGALELLRLVRDHPASHQATKDRANRLRVDMEAQLTGIVVDGARTSASAQTLEDAVDEVLNRDLAEAGPFTG